MKHTIKLLTLAFMLATILTLTGCPGPVNNYIEPPVVPEYTITVNVTNGTAEYPATAKAGDPVTITATAEDGYVYDMAWSAYEIPFSLTETSITWNLTMPAENVTINVTFKEVVEDNTTVNDGDEEPEQTTPEDTTDDDGNTDDTTTEDTTDNGDTEDEETQTVDIQYDDAGGYDGEIPGDTDDTHYEYPKGCKLILNVCTLTEWNDKANTPIDWKKVYFSFPENIEPNYSIKDLLGLKEYYKNKDVSVIISNDMTRFLEANVKITKDEYNLDSVYYGCYVVVE